jgi:hypothetical protein
LLIEARSIGGFSGSPVFVDLGAVRDSTTGSRYMGLSRIALLGVIHGHFTVPVREVVDQVPERFDAEVLNAGIVIVTPAEKLSEFF